MESAEDETQQDKIELQVSIRREAEIDILEAFVWYEEQLDGLGFDFLQVLDKAILSLQNNPELYQVVHKNIRRILLQRFPYAIFYMVENDKIVILACLHQRRHQDTLSDVTDE